MKKQTLIIILIICLAVSVGWHFYKEVYKWGFEEGVNQGQLSIVQEVNNGRIPVIVQQGNQTGIQWVSIQQICGG